uniref:Uncharacterized protein n=1 Tax=Rhizophora mucronata TaxID=61149 RepID=A0A2P2R0I2_RHIMU
MSRKKRYSCGYGRWSTSHL